MKLTLEIEPKDTAALFGALKAAGVMEPDFPAKAAMAYVKLATDNPQLAQNAANLFATVAQTVLKVATSDPALAETLARMHASAVRGAAEGMMGIKEGSNPVTAPLQAVVDFWRPWTNVWSGAARPAPDASAPSRERDVA